MTSRSTVRRRRLGATALGVGLALAAFGFVSPGASAQDPPDNPTFVDGANPKCADVEVGSFPSEFKIDQQPPDGDSTWDTTDAVLVGEVPASLVIEISNLVQGGGTVTFDWSATVADGDDAGTERDPFLIDAVLVKASTGANLYSYVPPASADTGLISPMSSISHISFCFGPHDDTTTSSEPTTSETTATSEPTTSQPTTSEPTNESIAPTDARPAATVAGVTVAAAALPATGADDYSLMIIGAALALAGGASLVLSNRAATAAAHRYQPKHRR